MRCFSVWNSLQVQTNWTIHTPAVVVAAVVAFGVVASNDYDHTDRINYKSLDCTD